MNYVLLHFGEVGGCAEYVVITQDDRSIWPSHEIPGYTLKTAVTLTSIATAGRLSALPLDTPMQPIR